MKLKNDFLEALLREISIRSEYLSNEPVNTVYFGGGTPSLLTKKELSSILSHLEGTFTISPGAEITLEANPDDITDHILYAWKEAGVNRLSIGVQSFFDEDLTWMNRAHSASQAYHALEHAIKAGLSNITIDLIYGTPGLNDTRWTKNLSTAVNLQIPHLSCYALTIEPGTPLDFRARKQKKSMVDPEDQARQFNIMTNYLEGVGYEHYEISNFALPGRRSIHNSSYWNGEKYLGLGPSAHSFDGTSRQWNVSNNALYIQSLQKNEVPFEKEVLTRAQKLNEYLMTSLRTKEGVDINFLAKHYGEALSEVITKGSRTFEERGWMINTSGRLVLTREGKLFADGIASELFVNEY